jgi:hypothetical protein
MKHTGLFPSAEDEVLEFTLEPFLRQKGRRCITFQTGLVGVLGKGGKGVEMVFDLNGCDESRSY